VKVVSSPAEPTLRRKQLFCPGKHEVCSALSGKRPEFPSTLLLRVRGYRFVQRSVVGLMETFHEKNLENVG